MRYGLLLALIVGLVISCIDEKDYDINSVNSTVSLAIPLAFGTLSIQDLLKQEDSLYVKVYPDDLVYLEYSSLLTSHNIRDLFSIPDVSINQSFRIPQGTIPAHSSDIRSDSLVEVVNLSLSPEQLSDIDYKTGVISYSATLLPGNANIEYDVILTSSALKTKSSGTPLFITTHSTGTLDLSDYEVTLDKNKFNLKMVLVLKKTNSPKHIAHNTSVAVNFAMKDMDFNNVRGFFGDQTVHPPSETISIGAFGNTLGDAHLSFLQPRINLEVTNDYGVPCKVNFSKIEGRKAGAILPLQLNPANPIAIAYPANLGTSAITPVVVSNAKDIMDFAPTELFYQLSARINQGLTSGQDFLADTSTMKVKIIVEVPLYGHGSGIILKDTAKIDFTKLDQSDIRGASLKVDVINELPLDARFQLYLADEHYEIIDSLLETSQTSLVKGSSVTASGDLETAGVMHDVVVLNPDKIKKVLVSRNFIIKAVLNTSKDAQGASQDVKFKSQYVMKISLGLLADVNVNLTK